MKKVKEIEISFKVEGTHTQRVIVPAGTDLEQLQADLENDVVHTTVTGKSIITKVDGRLTQVGTITSNTPKVMYHSFKIGVS